MRGSYVSASYVTIFNKEPDRRERSGRETGRKKNRGEPDMVMVKYEEYERVGAEFVDGIESGE